MDLAVRAVFESWNTDRAVIYRRQERIPADLGTAVNICSMVFGNLDMKSGTGVAFTRDPASGRQGRLRRLPAERAGRRRRRRHPQHGRRWPISRGIDKASYDELVAIMAKLEDHYRDLCDIEFTIERGKLWMLQTRVGKRTAGGRVPHRDPAGRRGPDRHGRGGPAGHRGAAGPADVPALRRAGAAPQDRAGPQRLARRRGRTGRLRLLHRGQVVALGRAGDPGPPRDQPRRPQRHDRRRTAS